MKRKKYVKQLMAMGYQRNRAEFRASLCRDNGIPYAVDYKAVAPWLQLGCALRGWAKAVARYWTALTENIAARKRLAAAIDKSPDAEELRVKHHDLLYGPVCGGPLGYNMQIVTQEEHAAIHRHDGYRATITPVDEMETAGGGGNE